MTRNPIIFDPHFNSDFETLSYETEPGAIS